MRHLADGSGKYPQLEKSATFGICGQVYRKAPAWVEWCRPPERGNAHLLGGASIASGYTLCRTRRSEAPAPLPLRGERSEMRKKKTAIITARMTPEDKQKIEQRAANAGMTVTDYLTTCALGKKIVRVDGLDKILAELKAQGRNLNQLTVLANMERLTVVRGDDLADGYAALCEQVHCHRQ